MTAIETKILEQNPLELFVILSEDKSMTVVLAIYDNQERALRRAEEIANRVADSFRNANQTDSSRNVDVIVTTEDPYAEREEAASFNLVGKLKTITISTVTTAVTPAGYFTKETQTTVTEVVRKMYVMDACVNNSILHYRDKILFLEENLRTKSELSDKLSSELKNARNDVQILQKTTRWTIQKSNEAFYALEAATSAMKVAQNKIDKLKNSAKKDRQKYESQKVEIDALRQLNCDLVHELAKVKEERDQLKEQSEKTHVEKDNKTDILMEELRNCAILIEELRDRANVNSRKYELQNYQTSKQFEEIQSLKAENAILSDEKKDLIKNLSQAKKELIICIESENDVLVQLNDELSKLSFEKNVLTEAVANLARDVDVLNQRCGDYEAKLEQHKVDKRELEFEKTAIESQNYALQNAIATLNEEFQTLTGEYDKLMVEHGKLRVELSVVNYEYTDCLEQTDRFEARVNAQLNDTNIELEKSQTELEELRKKYQKVEQDKELFKAVLQTLTAGTEESDLLSQIDKKSLSFPSQPVAKSLQSQSYQSVITELKSRFVN